MTKKICFKVVSSADTVFDHDRTHNITCESVKYEGETVLFYSNDESEIVASFYRPVSVVSDLQKTRFANMAKGEQQKHLDRQLEWSQFRINCFSKI